MTGLDPSQNAAFVIFASLAPLLIALFKQQGFSNQWNSLIAFAGYIIVGVAGALVSGIPLTIENAVSLITVATVVGSAAYNLIWDNLGVSTPTGGGNASLSLDKRLTEATSLVRHGH